MIMAHDRQPIYLFVYLFIYLFIYHEFVNDTHMNKKEKNIITKNKQMDTRNTQLSTDLTNTLRL